MLSKLCKRLILFTMLMFFVTSSIVPAVKGSAAENYSIKPRMRIQVATLPETMDPQKVAFNIEIGSVKLIYEGLTHQDSNLDIGPGAAESWTFSPDGRQVTFNLRSNLQYSDGSILNAKRFEYSILRALDPRVSGYYASNLDMISGAMPYRTADMGMITNQQLSALRAAVGVRALDSDNAPCIAYTQTNCRKLRIYLTDASLSILSVMSLWVVYPAKEELILSGGDNWWSDPSKQIGNGPFILSSYNTNERSLFLHNPHYWRGEPAYNIDFRYTSDSDYSLIQYKTGLLEILPVSPDLLPEIQTDPVLKGELHSYPGSCTFGIFFHHLKAPFNDPKVRAAFAYAFNREAWVEQVLNGNGITTLTWIPPGVPGYDASETRWAYDPDKALQALRESTYGSAAALPPITLTFSDTSRNRTRNEWLAYQWEAIFGIPIHLEPLDPTEYTARTLDVTTAPQTYMLGWCGDHPDPQNYLSIYWHSSSKYAKRFGYANPQVDALLEQADVEQDPVARLVLYQQAQTMILGDAPAAMAYNNRNIYLVKQHVKGARNTAFDNLWIGEVDPLTITIDQTFQFVPFVKR